MLKSEEISPETEKAYIYALFHLGHHLQLQVSTESSVLCSVPSTLIITCYCYQVALFLKTWQPKHPLDQKTLTLMEDFVGTRGKQYAAKTVQAVTKERNRLRKKGLVKPSKK